MDVGLLLVTLLCALALLWAFRRAARWRDTGAAVNPAGSYGTGGDVGGGCGDGGGGGSGGGGC